MTRALSARLMGVLALATLMALSRSAVAEEVTLPHTSVHFLRSKANGVEYKLYVSVPADYESSKKEYPVLYLLDMEYSFPVVRAIVQHLSERNRLKPLIVVGIGYSGPDRYRWNRTRDYTPHFAPTGGYGPEMQKVSGGGPKFLQTLREEVFPWVDRTYRTVEGDRGLSGHSYGGLFANWVLLTAPETFSHYVIVSPSLWYDGRFMFGLEKKARVRASKTPRAKVFLAVGGREGNAERDMVRDLERMSNALRQWKTLAVRSEVMDDETHDSVFPTAISRGIRFTYEGD